MIRDATQADLPELHRVLEADFASTMFLRSNLLEAGLGGAGDYAMTLCVCAQTGPSGGIFALTNNGFLLACAPDASDRMWAAFASRIVGKVVRGMTGVPAQVESMFAALGVRERDFQIDDVEPLYSLQLSALVAFEGDLRAPQAQEMAQLIEWQMAGNCETLGAAMSEEGRAVAQGQIDRFLERDVLRVLCVEGAPVCKTAFNAVLPDTVQVGGVYTPPALRGVGYARAAVALHLAQARTLGVRRAILFAANEQAARAYEAIGFERVGSYRVALFEEAMEVAA